MFKKKKETKGHPSTGEWPFFYEYLWKISFTGFKHHW